MAIQVLHRKTADSTGTNLVLSGDWNNSHAVTGTPGSVLGFDEDGEAVELEPSDFTGPTGPEGPPGDVNYSATIAELEAVDTSANQIASLGGVNGGLFRFDNSDLSSEVADDTTQAIYVALASDSTGASGAWIRQFSGAKDARWFGAIGDGVTDDYTALQAWLDSGGDLYLPEGEYYSSTRLEVRNLVRVQGVGFGFDATIAGYDNMPGSRIRFPEGQGGIIVWTQTTHDDTSDVVSDPATYFTQEGGSKSTFRDFALIGANTGVAVTGFESRTRVFLDNIQCFQFSGRGFDLQGSSDIDDLSSDYGNPAISSLVNCKAEGNGSHGFHIRGRDASVISIINCDAISNIGWGFWDQSLVGGNWSGNHAADNHAGSYKVTNVIGCMTIKDCYVEGDIYAQCDIPGQHWIIGGTLGGAPNASAYKAGGLSGDKFKTSYLYYINQSFGTDPGILAGTAYSYCHPAVGLVFSAPGFYFKNEAGNPWLTVGGGTINASFKGDVSLDGVDPTLTVNASGDVGPQFLMGSDGIASFQIYAAPSGTTYLSADTLLFRDKTTLASTRLTLDAAGANLGAGMVLKANGTQVVGAQQTAVADAVAAVAAPTQAEFNALVTQFNSLLSKMRAHGLIAT